MTAGARRAVVAGGALALPYLPFLFGVPLGSGIVAGAVLGLASLGAPAAAGVLGLRGRGAARRFVQGLSAALLANVVAAVVLRTLEVAPAPASFAAALGALVVGAGAIGAARGGSLPDPRRHRVATAVAAGAFLLAAFAGTSVVPPLEDQDSEVQGTAYGLAHDLEPLCLTNRSTLYFFAHPPLLHALNASTLTLAGELDTVRPSYDAARSARTAEGVPPGSRWERAWAAWRGTAPRPDRSLRWHRDVFGAFLRDPALTGTRAPNFLLAAAVAALLYSAARRLGAGAADAALIVAAYATLPEIAVRSGYGGYYALTAATFLASAGLASAGPGGGRSGYAAGVLAILANQKALVIGAAVLVAHAARAATSRCPRALASAAPYLAGLVLGGVAFWAYGLALAPEDFVADHLLAHGFERFAGGEILGRGGRPVYASRVGVWLEFANHFGWIWCALVGAGLVATVRELRSGRPRGTRQEAALLLAWIGVGALLFTWTDWRQTKHLCLLVPAFALLPVPLLCGRSVAARWIVRAALLASIAWSVVWIVRLARDFTAMAATPVW